MSFISSIFAAFKREVLEVAHNRLYLAIIMLIPLFMIVFFTVMFYRGEIVDLPIVAVDHSHSPSSRQLLRMIDATRGVDVAYEVQSIDEAERMMRHQEVCAMLYVPSDFESNIYRGIHSKVECYLPGTNISADGVVESNVQQVVMTFAAGVSLSMFRAQGVGDAEAMVEIMPIKLHSNIVANPYLNYGYYLAPLFMLMGVVIITVVATTYAVGRELRYATSEEWLRLSGGSLLAALVGKLILITIVMAVMVQLILVVLVVVMGMNIVGSYLFLTLSSLVFIVAYQSVALFIVATTANLRLALSLGGGYAVMAFTFSGITFPVTAMYGAIQPIAKLFPLGYFSEIFIDQMMLGVPIIYDIPKLGSLLIFLLLPLILWRRLRRIMFDSNYWCRG